MEKENNPFEPVPKETESNQFESEAPVCDPIGRVEPSADAANSNECAADENAVHKEAPEAQADDGCSYHFGQFSENGRPPVNDPPIGQASCDGSAAGAPQQPQGDGTTGQTAGQTPPCYGQAYGYAPQYAQNSKPVKKRRGLIAFLSITLAVVVTACSVSIGFLAGRSYATDGGGSVSSPSQSSPSSSGKGSSGSKSSFSVKTEGAGNRSLTYEQVISSVSDSIVSITIYNTEGSSGAYASGIIMDAEQGYVVTNDHIYESTPNAKFIITLRSGAEFKADFVSGDSRNDIGILKIRDPKDLVAATFSSESATVGEEVLAIGMSAGLSGTITQGIVSAVDRRVKSGSYSEKFIQTTAAINPGNSGGALVNMSGQVIGITSSKYADSTIEGICFAIPTTRALGVIEQLQKNGRVVGRAKLGITYTAVTSVISEVNNIPTGLLIQEISSESDLYGKAAVGDIITHINGEEITNDSQVLDVIEKASAGDRVGLTLCSSSSGESYNITVKYIEDVGYSNYSTESSSESTESTESNPYDILPFGDRSK